MRTLIVLSIIGASLGSPTTSPSSVTQNVSVPFATPSEDVLGADKLNLVHSFWQLFGQTYILFDEKGMSWPSEAPDTTFNSTESSDVFEVLCDMIGPLQDPYTSFSTPCCGTCNSMYGLSTPPPYPTEWKDRARKTAGIPKLHQTANNRIAFGLADQERYRGLGYIQINSLSGLSGEASEQKDAEAALSSLSDIIAMWTADSQPLLGIILDIRANAGGSEQVR